MARDAHMNRNVLYWIKTSGGGRVTFEECKNIADALKVDPQSIRVDPQSISITDLGLEKPVDKKRPVPLGNDDGALALIVAILKDAAREYKRSYRIYKLAALRGRRNYAAEKSMRYCIECFDAWWLGKTGDEVADMLEEEVDNAEG